VEILPPSIVSSRGRLARHRGYLRSWPRSVEERGRGWRARGVGEDRPLVQGATIRHEDLRRVVAAGCITAEGTAVRRDGDGPSRPSFSSPGAADRPGLGFTAGCSPRRSAAPVSRPSATTSECGVRRPWRRCSHPRSSSAVRGPSGSRSARAVRRLRACRRARPADSEGAVVPVGAPSRPGAWRRSVDAEGEEAAAPYAAGRAMNPHPALPESVRMVLAASPRAIRSPRFRFPRWSSWWQGRDGERRPAAAATVIS
jgi:hypothetical protein